MEAEAGIEPANRGRPTRQPNWMRSFATVRRRRQPVSGAHDGDSRRADLQAWAVMPSNSRRRPHRNCSVVTKVAMVSAAAAERGKDSAGIEEKLRRRRAGRGAVRSASARCARPWAPRSSVGRQQDGRVPALSGAGREPQPAPARGARAVVDPEVDLAVLIASTKRSTLLVPTSGSARTSKCDEVLRASPGASGGPPVPTQPARS